MQKIPLLPVLMALGLFIRLTLIPNPGFEADISFWKSWGLATVDKGAVEGLKITNNNYPTPFVYTLGTMVWVYKLFADPHNFQVFWNNTNLLFLAISKFFPILADFGIAALLLYIGNHAKKLGFPVISFSPGGLSLYQLLSVAYVLNPVALMDGAWWGQVDSLGVCIFLAALVLALKKQAFWAGTVFVLAMMTKLQNMIYAPVFFLFIWQTLGFTGLMRALAGAAVGFVGLNIEFLASHNADRVLLSLTQNYDYFPWMSLMAFNLWWIVTGAQGMVTSDKLSILGLLNAKTIGLMLFSSFYLFAVMKQLWDTHMSDASHRIRTFLESLIIVNAAFFLFQTQSHDRYAFPLTVFLLLWLPFYLSNHEASVTHQKRRFVLFSVFYLLFTVFYFYNLHTALVVNYPNNGIPLLSALTQPFFTIATAYILLGLFCLFIIALLRFSRITQFIALIVLVILVSSLLTMNYSLFTKRPVPLGRFTPYISEQAYGTRQTNKSVQSSFGGPYKWTRLSVQYLFYDKGIGTHANSKHVFDIGNRFNTFTTDMGIDTEAGSQARAIFEIWGDDRLLYRSEPMGRFDLPKHADVNITGVNQLSLITTDAGDGNNDDHTDWLNPTLWP